MKVVREHLPEGSGLALDVGCGQWLYHDILLKKGYEPVGIDVNRVKISNFVLADACHLPFKDGVFHLVLTVDVIEHIENHELAFKEMYRVLKTGDLVLHTPNSAQTHVLAEFPEQSDHVRKGYTEEELDEFLSKANFKEIEVHATFNPLECIAWEVVNLGRIDQTLIEKLINFDLEKYKNLGWICIARKS